MMKYGLTFSKRWILVGWVFWVYLPFETVFQSISGRLPGRGRKKREKIEESKNVLTTPTRTHCKCNRPLPYYQPNCRTPRNWKFTQDHRTTRSSLSNDGIWVDKHIHVPSDRSGKRAEDKHGSKNTMFFPSFPWSITFSVKAG